ncbi:sorting nexin-29-like isoform X2 [Octopus vulgaris]|uniref:Sorting nexin-29-like isoform X2 n=1 Tax=Octopus vulgaris TaxID=6645 RepID=A0AA36F0M4_OCTVU|nr:sorting nexin-29-like isoform X2 [Octopus vulgaris]
MSFSNHDEEKENARKVKITKELSKTLKALQASQMFDEPVQSNELSNRLCDILEAIFLHGLKEPVTHKLKMFMQPTSGQVTTLNFWKFISRFTHKNVIAQIQDLNQIKTDVGYCRVWIRLALNDGILGSYIDVMTADVQALDSFYHHLSYLRDLEQPGILKSYVQGITAFQFELPYNSSVLNSWMNIPLLLAGVDGVAGLNDGISIEEIGNTRPPPVAVTPGRVVESVDVSVATSPSKELPNEDLVVIKKLPPDPKTDDKPSTSNTVEVKTVLKKNIKEKSNSVSDPVNNPSQTTDDLSHKSDKDVRDNTKHSDTSISSDNNVPQQTDLNPSHDSNPQPQNKPMSAHQKINQRPKTLELSNSPGNHSLNLGNSLEVASGWSSHFREEMNPEVMTEPAEIVEVQDAESFETLLNNYHGEQSLSPIPFGEIAENSPEQKENTEERSEKESIDNYADFEVLNAASFLVLDPDSKVRISNLMRICNEKGIASQNYRCKNCPSPLGLLFGKPLVCVYDGCYYCSDCHHNGEFYIPSKIIFNWDFSKYKVSVKNLEFLKEIQEYPLIDIAKVNPELYDYITDMRDVKLLRIRLSHLSSYLFTCKKTEAEKFRQSFWPKEYLYEDVHLYSLIDFLQIQCGQLQMSLKKLLKTASKHVYECGLCSQKGFICEICKNAQVIYPFEMDTTYRCEQCKAVYHKSCMNQKDQCPKCERQRERILKVGPLTNSSEADYDIVPWETINFDFTQFALDKDVPKLIAVP